MAYYRRIEIVNGETAEPAQWVAVHPFRWGHIMVSTDPDAAFVEDETIAARLAAAEGLAAALNAVEFVMDGEEKYCPWCIGDRQHFPNCPRQIALATWESPSENEEA